MSDQENNFSIEIEDSVADGTFSNLAIINHSNTEFVVDFVSLMPGSSKAKVKSRIILTPSHAKRLLKALSQNIERFEFENGEIIDLDNTPKFGGMNFGSKGQA